MGPYWIKRARVPGTAGLQCLFINAQGQLARIDAEHSQDDGYPVHDWAGDWLSLGGVDLQINGGLGLAFPDLVPGDEPRLAAIAQYLWQQGVDAFLPTIVTTSVEKIHQALKVLANFEPQEAQATILGAHLEGPFLNPAKRGAHPEQYLQPLSLERVQAVLGEHSSQVKVMTLAPELEPSGDCLAYLQAQQIVISLGHSLATAAEAELAFQRGATMVTHAFNAMPPLHHRQPGLLAAALLHPGVCCGFIADGQHVDPRILTLLIRAAVDHLFLVSDALAPIGLPDGQYPWDDRQINVTNGTARLSDNTLAGTTRPLLDGVKNLVRWGCCSIETAIALATEAPRQAIGLPGFGIGQPASLFLRWRYVADTKELTWSRWEREGLFNIGEQASG